MYCTVLVGPKHSGKTSAGRALALLLAREFVDLDEYIAQRSGKSPRALYIEGPAIFRKAEADALAALIEPDTAQPAPLVIAGGGGLADNPEAFTLLTRSSGAVIVFLDVSVQTAWDRIIGAGELPPFLQTENPRETHRLLHERRAAAYRQAAALVIPADGKTPEAIAREIMNATGRMDCFG